MGITYTTSSPKIKYTNADSANDQTPDVKIENRPSVPILTNINDAASNVLREVAAPPRAFVNNATFGTLDAIDNAFGKEPEIAQTPVGKSIETLSALLGSFYGPGEVANAVGKRVLPEMAMKPGVAGNLARVARGLTEGATLGALLPNNLENRAKSAMFGGFMGAAPAILFPKQMGGKVREYVGKALGDLRDKITQTAPFLRMSKNDIIQRIDDALASAPFESGPQRQALIKIKNRLSAMNRALTFDEAVQLEQQMGREASFASDATQGKFARGPKAPRSNETLKTERARVSGKVDEMASNAGYPEHVGLSRDYSKLAKAYPEKDLQKMYSPTGMLIRGSIGGAGLVAPFILNPLSVVASLPLAWENIPPKYKTMLFRNIVDTRVGKSIGKGATIALSDLLRRFF